MSLLWAVIDPCCLMAPKRFFQHNFPFYLAVVPVAGLISPLLDVQHRVNHSGFHILIACGRPSWHTQLPDRAKSPLWAENEDCKSARNDGFLWQPTRGLRRQELN